MSLEDNVRSVCKEIERCAGQKERIVVGIAGPPASGKSTLAEAVVESLNSSNTGLGHAALLPMDGFHLDNCLLEPQGLLDVKGSPQTFDADGFCRLVQRLQVLDHDIIHPVFDRTLDKAIAGAGVIRREDTVVVVEGNYLLLRSTPWASLYPLFHLSVFISPSMGVLKQRLIDRWKAHGFAPNAALEKANRNDLPNAQTVLTQSVEANLVFDE